jgi:hypothetical protein
MSKKKKDLRMGRESGHWKPGLWDSVRVRRYVRHVRKWAIKDANETLQGEVWGRTWLQLSDLFDGVVSRREINARGYKTLGELQSGGTADGATARDAVVPEQEKRDDSVSGKPARAD